MIMDSVGKVRNFSVTIQVNGDSHAKIERTYWVAQDENPRDALLRELRALTGAAQNDVDASLLLLQHGSKVFPVRTRSRKKRKAVRR